MSTAGTLPQLRRLTKAGSRLTKAAPMWAGGLLFLLVLWLLMVSGRLNLLCAVLVAGPLLLLYLCDKSAALLAIFAYLFLLGDIRRIVSVLVGQPVIDPFLLLAPLMALVLALPSLFHLRLIDPLSKAMFALLLLMVLEALNPAQGGLATSLAGVFFYLVPVLWFWVGRSMGSPLLVTRLLYRVVFPLALLAGLLGLGQSFIGFLPYQQAWITAAIKAYTSLYVGSTVRPFGFSVSAAEYGTLLQFSLAAIVAASFASRRGWLLALPVLATAFTLASGRGVMIKLFVALPITWIMRRRTKLSLRTVLSIAILGVLSLLTLSSVAAHFAPAESNDSRNSSAAENAFSHQVSGLAHPFDERYSTAGAHSDMVLSGLMQAVKTPLGQGLGASTFAATKFQTDQQQGSSELDFSDMFISLGLLGGLLYLGIAGLAARAALRYLQSTPLPLSLPVFAILVTTLGAWLIGGQYSVCALVFFLMGSLVYQENQPSPQLPLAARLRSGIRPSASAPVPVPSA